MFVSAGLELPVCDNIIYIENNTKRGWLKRIYWDWFGCPKFISEHKINVKKVISPTKFQFECSYEQIILLSAPANSGSVKLILLNDITFDNVKLFL